MSQGNSSAPTPVVAVARWAIAALATHLGVGRVTLSRVLNGHAAVSADMAHRFAAALPPSAEFWLRLQAAYDLWEVQRQHKSEYRRISKLSLATT